MPSPAGFVILQAQERFGWTLETLSHKSGVPWRTLYNHTTGRRRVMHVGNATMLRKALLTAGMSVPIGLLRGNR